MKSIMNTTIINGRNTLTYGLSNREHLLTARTVMSTVLKWSIKNDTHLVWQNLQKWKPSSSVLLCIPQAGFTHTWNSKITNKVINPTSCFYQIRHPVTGTTFFQLPSCMCSKMETITLIAEKLKTQIRTFQNLFTISSFIRCQPVMQ